MLSVNTLWMYLRTMECIGLPSAAKAFSEGCEKTLWCGWIVDNPEKPLLAAKTSRSNAWSPMATATRGDVDAAVEMMPKGIFASEKWDPRGMLNHDRREAML